MRKNKFTFLVVGTNFISDNFADAVAKVDRACGVYTQVGGEGFPGEIGASGCEIGAVLSRKRETGEAFCSRHGLDARVVCTLEEAASLYEDGGFDAAYIASPNVLHESQSVFFLERGIHVLCEKPAAADMESLGRMTVAAVKGNARFVEAMRPAHDPAITAIRRGMEKIAPVRMARLEFSQYSSRYDRFLSGERVNTFDPAMGNAALLDLGVYAIACALMLFGEPENITSNSVFLDNGFEAAGTSTFVYPDFLCNINYSKVCETASPSVILGEKGAITIDRLSEPKDVRIRMGKSGAFEPIEPGAPDNNMIYEIADFVRICTAESVGDCADIASAGTYPCADESALLSLSRAQCDIIEKICLMTGIKFTEAK